MGRKVPMWQCLLVIVAMVVFLFWGVMVSGKTYVPIRTGAKNVKLSGRTAKKFSRLF